MNGSATFDRNDSSLTAYPLVWPENWPRTPPTERLCRLPGWERQTWKSVDDRLGNELHRFKADNIVLSTMHPVRKTDGWRHGGKRKVEDPGAAVCFSREGRSFVMAEDKYVRVIDNVRSLALALEGLRKMHRHGGGVMLERTSGEGKILGYALVSPAELDEASHHQHFRDAGTDMHFEDLLTTRDAPRPGFKKLMACAGSGDTVVVSRLDHLGRSLPEVVRIVHELRHLGFHFRSVEDNIDTSVTPGAFNTIDVLHEFECRRQGRLVRAGLAAAEKSGRRPGRPGADPARIAEAIRLVDNGRSVTKAAKQAGIGRSTLYKEMARERTLPRPPEAGI